MSTQKFQEEFEKGAAEHREEVKQAPSTEDMSRFASTKEGRRQYNKYYLMKRADLAEAGGNPVIAKHLRALAEDV